jgi:hypothetical protein
LSDERVRLFEATDDRIGVHVFLVSNVHVAEDNGVFDELLLSDDERVLDATRFGFTELTREGIAG